MNPVVWHLGPRSAALAERLAAAVDGGEIRGPATADLAAALREGRPIVAVAATGIVVRLLAPLLTDKRQEPPVLVVDEAGRFVVPLLGGHRGANALAERLAAAIGAQAGRHHRRRQPLRHRPRRPARRAFASPIRIAPSPSWRPCSKAPAAVSLDPLGLAGWLTASRLPFADAAGLTIEVTQERRDAAPNHLTYHPQTLALGVGCERHASAEELEALVMTTLAEAGLAPEAVACVVSLDLKAAEPAVHALSQTLDVPARFLDRDALAAETPRLATPSAVVEAEIGIPGVAEAAALAAAGPAGRLLVTKRKSQRCTVAVAIAPAPIDPAMVGRAQGRLTVLGFGPGDTASRTPAVSDALRNADLVIGYGLYLDLVAELTSHAECRRYPLGEERERCIAAIEAAVSGPRRGAGLLGRSRHLCHGGPGHGGPGQDQ